jgi:signal transduction histidine kinase
LQVNYSDDGFGFNYDEIIKANKGIGLLNIQSRINSFGGVIQYKSNLNKGIEVHIDVPLINTLKAS